MEIGLYLEGEGTNSGGNLLLIAFYSVKYLLTNFSTSLISGLYSLSPLINLSKYSRIIFDFLFKEVSEHRSA